MNQTTWDIGKLFTDKYKEVTARLSCIDLEEVSPFEMKEDCIFGKVETKPNAPYNLVLFCDMSGELAKQIVSRMSNGTVNSPEDVIIYIREYINIASGRAVSTINNYVGKSARFNVPEVQEEKLLVEDVEGYESYASAFLKSEYGEMILKVAYTIDGSLN
ncbi:chemotaxis protein CheX [Anaerosporobacter faecicola]|uniref:chemotaxis protein CheX n=1 Tax=Anaerosporobacter faecicola TaxID=2718714 RepID=UPI001438F706|nr:chemotaxis protein CheX [Anaerosporobacter faecicola]